MIKTNDLHVAVATLVVCFVSLNMEKKARGQWEGGLMVSLVPPSVSVTAIAK